MPDEIRAILLASNIAGWRTWYHGAPRSVVSIPRNWQDGRELLGRAPPSHAADAVKWLAVEVSHRR